MEQARLRTDLEKVLRDEPERFAEVVRGLPGSTSPPTRDELMIVLLELRDAMRSEADEHRESLVLDLLDWIVGWCSPGSQPLG